MLRSALSILVVLSFLFGASEVQALDMEYYTYNGFDAVMTAWQQTAMVFANGEYAALFFSVIFAAILFGGVSMYYKIFQGANVSPLAWAMPIGFGIVIYLGAFVPKATLHIYDPVLNRYQPVSNVPQGVAFIAGTLNLIERGIVEIIETSAAPLSYKEYAGGIGFDSLLKATGNLSMNDKYIEASVGRYITDCMYFELNRPGSSLKLSDLMSNGGTLLTLFGEAANPAIFTVWYNSAEQAGATVSCLDAHVNITAYFSDPLKVDSLVRAKCANAGFNPDDASELLRCKQSLEATVQFTTGNSISTEKFFQQTVLAQQLSYAATMGGVEETIRAKGSVNTMSSMYGAGMQANEWIPIIRAVVTAVAIGLLPVLIIFIPTGIGNKALAMIAGFFIWITFWGVTDAIIHQIAVKYAYKFFEQARQNNIGYASIMVMPDAAAKSLALFGLIRSMGMGLATAITIKIANFVDAHSLAMIGGQLSGSVQQQGAAAGEMAKIEGTSEAVRGPVAASATWANAYKYGVNQMATSQTADQMTATQSTLGSIDHMGGGDMHRAVDRMSGANVTQRAEDVGRAEGKGGPGHSEYMGSQGGQQSFGSALQDTKMAQALGISQRELGEFRQHGVITDKMAPAIGNSLGLGADQSKKLLSGMKVNHNSLSVNQDDGRLMLTGAEIQSADGSRSVGGGMVTESSMMTGRQIMDKAGELEKRGHSEAAEGLRKLVNGNVASSDGRHHGMAERGRGLLANETATFSEKQSYDGRTAETYVKHGSDVSWFDTSSDRQGRTVRKGDEADIGDHSRLGNTVTLDDGTHIPAQSAFQMAMDKNPLLVSQLFKPGLSDAERTSERINVAGSVAEGMSSFISRAGTSEDYSGVEGALGGSLGVIGGSVRAGYNTTDRYNVNLGTQHYDKILSSAEQEAASKGLNEADTKSFATDRLQEAVLNEVKYFEKHGKWSYGTTGIAGRAVDAVKDSVKKNNLDLKRGGVDGIKG
jgi:hypothetical protein